MTTPPDIGPEDAARMVDTAGALLLDVREDDEWSAGHAPGAVHVRLGELNSTGLDAARPVVAVCRSGNRSRMAAVILAEAGFAVYNLAGGMKAWHGNGSPVVRDDGSTGSVI